MSIALLLDILLKATVLFAAAELLNALLRRSSAAARHVVWTAALAWLQSHWVSSYQSPL